MSLWVFFEKTCRLLVLSVLSLAWTDFTHAAVSNPLPDEDVFWRFVRVRRWEKSVPESGPCLHNKGELKMIEAVIPFPATIGSSVLLV